MPKKSQVINQIWVNYKLGKSDTVHMHDCEMRANYEIKNKNWNHYKLLKKKFIWSPSTFPLVEDLFKSDILSFSE